MANIGIRKRDYKGMPAVEVATRKALLIAVTAVGPRIAHFGPAGGRNLLFWDEENRYRRRDWHLQGGHRIWTTRPMADENEESYAEDNDPCRLTIRRNGFNLRGAVHPLFRIRKTVSVKVLDESTFLVENRITNESDMLWSGGVWGVTCTGPGPQCTYGIPLGDGSDWDVFTLAIPKRWGGGQTSLVNDPAIRFTEDCLVVTPNGRISKRAVQAPQGIIGMTDGREGISFIKKSDYVPGGKYPWGCNIAYYVGEGNFMVEMETMGPEKTVLPGAAISTRETWMLRAPVDWAKVTGKESWR